MDKIRSKKVWDRSGVSEVVGTILTLGITVILFSGILVSINQFPAPGENVFTSFSANIEPYDDWNDGANVTITNTGGTVLLNWTTRVILSVDAFTYSLDTKGSLDGRTYGLAANAIWDTGETWRIWLNNTQINEDSNVGVMIIDIEKNVVIWSADITGKDNQFGPIVHDIWVDSNLDTIRKDPIDFGREFYLFTSVTDPDGDLDVTSVYADLSSIDPFWSNIPLTLDADGNFRSAPMTGPSVGSVPIGYHLAMVFAHDLATPQQHHSSGVGRIPVGQDIGSQPNLVIRGDDPENNAWGDVEVSSRNPTNGQTISISATVRNFGGHCVANLSFYDEVGGVSTWIASQEISPPEGPSQIKSRSIVFQVSGGGIHNIWAEVTPIDVVDFDSRDNSNYTQINVMPTILLVDDDGHASDRSPYDTVGFMRSALDACDFNYDLYRINQGYNGPEYRYGEMRMRNYDVVIWMCGYESENTLTAADQDNITMYLHDADGTGSAGSLWLIGQKLLYDVNVPDSFFEDEIKMKSKWGPLSGPTNLTGVAGNPVSDEWNASKIPVIERAPGEGESYIIEPDTWQGAEITFVDLDMIIPLNANAINYENTSTGERVLFFPFEYSRIERPSDQTQVTYKAIMWLGNISQRLGNDLAISEQTIEPTYVFLNQNVNVTAVVRNNGADDLEDVEAMLSIDGKYDSTTLTNFTITGLGGIVTISTLWKANSLGPHVLKWVVDPNDDITETNEHNNMVPSYMITGEVFVKFRILVVDDDGSRNNDNGNETGFHNETEYITDSIRRIGYEYEYNGTNSTYVVGIGNKNGPSRDLIKDYSAVIWVTGDAPSGLTSVDNTTLTDYLVNDNGQVWIIGTDIWSGISGSGLPEIMGIDNIFTDTGLSGHLLGVDDSNISHGMDIPIIDCPNADAFELSAGAEGVFSQNYTSSNYSAVLYDDGDYRSLAFGFNCTTLYGSEDGLISGDNATDEITYMVLRWFGKPETRKEARITLRDVFVSDAHPLIGGAYILRTTVHNVGASETNILVRFKDGDTQIDSDSVSIEPGATTTAEVIWTPLYAGQRDINIFVDPIGEVPEIFEWFNNNLTFGIYVYFFWDDMESGDSKWTHGSTIININGEGPLDGYSNYSMDTDVQSDWNRTVTHGVVNTTVTAHTYPNSFYMEEGTGLFGRADVLISFAIDDSRSMSMRATDPPVDPDPNYDTDGDGDPTNDITWLDRAKDATYALLGMLSEDSVCVSIWDYNGGSERRWGGPNVTLGGRVPSDPLTVTEYNRLPVRMGDTYPSIINGTPVIGRDYIRDEIRLMDNPAGQTILWDSIGEAYLDTQHWASSYPELQPVVIVLSDGADLQAADTSAPQAQKFESGSNWWCPWANESDGIQYYEMHRGKYTFDMYNPESTTKWLRAMDHGGSIEKNRTGLLNASMKIFTIGLGLEHHDNLSTQDVMEVWEPTIDTWPGEVLDYYNAYCNDTGVVPPCHESGTVEYNLWRVANTTGAMYFYAPDADALEGIFIELGMMLAQGINQTRASNPEPQTRALHDNYDKWAVTETFNLTGMENAKLSFWHKYNILQGANGAFLQVSYKDPNVDSDGDGDFTNDWDKRYIIPPGQYTGMLYYEELISDDFGNPIQWCWNGLSGSGTPVWDYAMIDILPFVPVSYRSEVRVVFNYSQFGGGTGVGWFIDDVRLVVSRSPTAIINDNMADVWQMNDTTAHSGSYCWSNADPTTGHMKPGIDNHLMTAPIDLTNAKTAYLSAYFKFNVNYAGGSPPDGFRVEVTSDGGMSWSAINLGVRASWGVSGTSFDGDDGNATDGKSYTGLPESDPVTDDYWVNASSLTRLNVDISSWSGNQIRLRFRVVTNNLLDNIYRHNENPLLFGGLFVDDVIVKGETIFG